MTNTEGGVVAVLVGFLLMLWLIHTEGHPRKTKDDKLADLLDKVKKSQGFSKYVWISRTVMVLIFPTLRRAATTTSGGLMFTGVSVIADWELGKWLLEKFDQLIESNSSNEESVDKQLKG